MEPTADPEFDCQQQCIHHEVYPAIGCDGCDDCKNISDALKRDKEQ